MRQTFFHELSELEKREKEEKKERVELYLRNRSVALRDALPLISISVIILFSVAAATYAIYLFIDLTRINDAANVHVTKNMKLAVRSIQGTVYNNPEKGIHNWMLHRDIKNGFEFAHPDHWIMNPSSSSILEIKKYNSQRSANESLSAIIFINKIENEKNLPLEKLIEEETGLTQDLLKKETINGKDFLRTGNQKDPSGLMQSRIFWEREGNNYNIKVVYYNQNNKNAENDLEKMLAEFKIK